MAQDLQPTLRDVRALSPDLRRFFRDLDPLIKASRTGLPAGSEVIRGLKPTLAELTPFLQQVNPILQYLEMSQFQVSDFITNGAAALSDTEVSPGGGVGHYLRQFGPLGAESLAIYKERLKTNRGNSYPPPLALFGDLQGKGIFPNYDCKPSGGEVAPSEGNPGLPRRRQPDGRREAAGHLPARRGHELRGRQVRSARPLGRCGARRPRSRTAAPRRARACRRCRGRPSRRWGRGLAPTRRRCPAIVALGSPLRSRSAISTLPPPIVTR